MTFLVERLSELRKHLDHLHGLQTQVSVVALKRDLSLHNDVLFSLLTVCQLVIDISAELSTRQALGFEDYTAAVRNLGSMDLVDGETLAELERLPGFRNVLVHEYVSLDFERVVEAANRLEPIRDFLEAVRKRVAEE